MNYQKYFKSTALISNPLCGIDTYKDVLNLATGQITRAIKKLILDGTEPWVMKGTGATIRYENSPILSSLNSICYCSHFKNTPLPQIPTTDNSFAISYTSAPNTINIRATNYSTIEDFIVFLESEYANRTPVTIWYVLETPETEQITVPSGLSGTVEGYLTQSGTPTPTNPIYPVANDAVGWYGIKNYVRATTWTDGSTYARSGGSWSSSLTKKRSRKKK